jgi:hypothetical protein
MATTNPTLTAYYTLEAQYLKDLLEDTKKRLSSMYVLASNSLPTQAEKDAFSKRWVSLPVPLSSAAAAAVAAGTRPLPATPTAPAPMPVQNIVPPKPAAAAPVVIAPSGKPADNPAPKAEALTIGTGKETGNTGTGAVLSKPVPATPGTPATMAAAAVPFYKDTKKLMLLALALIAGYFLYKKFF